MLVTSTLDRLVSMINDDDVINYDVYSITNDTAIITTDGDTSINSTVIDTTETSASTIGKGNSISDTHGTATYLMMTSHI